MVKKKLDFLNKSKKYNNASLLSSLQRLYKKFQYLNKSKSRPCGQKQITCFLNSDFQFPVTRDKCESNDTCKSQEGSFLTFEIQSLETVASDLANELNTCKIDNAKLGLQISNAESVIKSRDETLMSVESKISSKSSDLKRTQEREKYYREKSAKLDSSLQDVSINMDELQEKYDILVAEMKEKDKQINDLLCENEYLRNLLEDNETFVTFDNASKRYTPDMQKCIYELLDNVSASKIGSVIQTVLKLVDRKPDRLPAKSTVLEMNLQRLALSQRQLGDNFSLKENTCLETDETSKRGIKYMGYEACDSDGKLWVLGLREMTTKSSHDTLKVFKEILSDIDVVSESSQSQKSSLILKHIVSTMSDRASTELKFNSLLEEYRETILPLIDSNFFKLAESERKAVSRLANFFCGLHSLVHIAETSKTSIKEAEKGFFGEKVPGLGKSIFNINEPGTVRLVRTACKAFAAGGDEKSGCFGKFSVYMKPFLKLHNLRSIPLETFRGSRFNILFSNAACVFHLRKHMLSFLQQNGAENALLKSVLHDLQVREFLAAVKALGLISKFVACPLWSVVEDKDVHIFDMNIRYRQLINFFQEASDNLEKFMEGKILPFGEDTHVKKDCVFNELMKNEDFDGLVQVILAIVLPAIGVLCKRLFSDHLEGGVIGEMNIADNKLRTKFKSVPKSSVFAESVFGRLDQLLKEKPSISTIACEAYIMFSQNKTLEWLNQQKPNEQDSLLAMARKEGRKINNLFKERKKEIEEEKRKAILEKIKAAEEAKRKKEIELEEYSSEMIEFGLWQTETEVESYKTKSHKIRALKAQLRFRQHVLKQVHPDFPNIFNQSKVVEGKRTNLSVEELTLSVKRLVSNSIIRETNSGGTAHILTGRRIKHKFTDAKDKSAENWWTGKVISQVPGYAKWFNVIYDSHEGIVYTYRLEEDLAEGNLQILI